MEQPSNYVSILHLRERWLKENEGNQTQTEKEQQEQLEEKNDRKPEDVKPPVVQNPRIYTDFRRRNGSGKFPMYYRAVPASNPCKKTEDEGEPPLAVPASTPRIVKAATCKKTEDEGEPPLAVLRVKKDEKKKKSSRKVRKKNPRAQSEEMDRTSRTPEENLKEEMRETECKVGVQDGKKNVRARRIDEKKGNLKENPRAHNEEMDRTSRTPEENLKGEMRETGCEVRVQSGKKNVRARKINEKKRLESQFGPKTGHTPEMKEMENKLGCISVKIDEKKRMESQFGPETGHTPEMKEMENKLGCISVKIDEKKRMESQCGPEICYTPEMKEMENKLGRFSVSFKIRRERNNGGYRGSSQGNRNLHPWALRKQRDVGMIWVRKDELSKGA